MKLDKVTSIDQVKKGDLIVIKRKDQKEPLFAKVQLVKVSSSDGTEVIYDLKKNLYFNLGMYLENKSIVTEAYVLNQQEK